MKKVLLWAGVGILVLLIVVVVAVDLFLDKAIKSGVETLGPKYTKVDVTLDSASLSLLSGAGTIKGLVLGNPEGYTTPHAITVGEASLVIKPATLLSDKVVIRSIYLRAPEITFEGNLSGNNLKTILDNVQSTTGSSGGKTNAAPNEKPETSKPGKKLEVDDFIINDAKVYFSLKGSGKTTTFTIPDIHFSDLGTGPEGITSAELTQRILKEIEQDVVKEVTSGDLKRAAESVVNDLGKNVNGGLSNVTKSIDNLLKPK
jgi:uncharacterized protein involved in outer membrane biogenesis